MQQNTLGEAITATAQRNAHAVAMVYGSTVITYERFIEAVDRLAAGLQSLGLRRGDRLALMLPNLPHFAIAYYALLKLGVWVVPLNVMLKEAEIQYILEDSEASGFIGWGHFSRSLSRAAANLERCRLHVFLGEQMPAGSIGLLRLMNDARAIKPPTVPSNENAVVLYTAGTTGHPKGAMLSHGNLLAGIHGCRDALLVTPDDRVLAVLPLFHSFGQTVAMHVPLLSGACLILHSKFEPAAIIDSLERDRVSIFPGVPRMFEQLLELKPPKEKLSTLKFCVTSGAPLPEEVREKMTSRYDRPILAGYGLSECSPFVAVQQPQRETRRGSVGLPLPGLEVRIHDNDGRSLAVGEMGDIAVRGEVTMRGYLNRSEATKDVLGDGWLMTGDIGYIDADGFLFIVDRKKDLILKAGFNVYPSEVEEFINAHPKVDECAVIGVPDKHHGEEVKAFVVLRPGQHSNKDEIIQYCREKMATYKCPKHIEFCGSLPRGATGKVLKRLLREKKPGGAMPSAALPSHESIAPSSPAANLKTGATTNQDMKRPAGLNFPGDAKPLTPSAPADEQSQNSLSVLPEEQSSQRE